MDYIDRRLRRLHADNLFWEREYRRALSRTWILRDRLAHIPPTMLDGIEGVASSASTLSAVADRAARLRRRATDARNRLAVFDPERQRQANLDVDGRCRYLEPDGARCGSPTREGSRWCARHVNLWCDYDPDGGHAVGLWREIWLDTLDGAFARLTMCHQVSAPMLRATVARSKAALQAEPYETDDLCTPADIVRWTTIPDEYDIEPKKNPCHSPLG